MKGAAVKARPRAGAQTLGQAAAQIARRPAALARAARMALRAASVTGAPAGQAVEGAKATEAAEEGEGRGARALDALPLRQSHTINLRRYSRREE